jgi:hypothetical protein
MGYANFGKLASGDAVAQALVKAYCCFAGMEYYLLIAPCPCNALSGNDQIAAIPLALTGSCHRHLTELQLHIVYMVQHEASNDHAIEIASEYGVYVIEGEVVVFEGHAQRAAQYFVA